MSELISQYKIMLKFSSKIFFCCLKVIAFSLLTFSYTGLNIFAQTENQVVAIVNDRRITQSEVDNPIASQLLPLQKQLYALRKAALENLIARAVLEEEANNRGISVDELKKQLTAIKVEIPSEQVEQAYIENATAFAQMSPDESKERLRLDLESQARMRNYRQALSKLREKARVEISLSEPAEPTLAVSSEGPTIGDNQAAVTIIEFSDFQCPFCKQSLGVIKQVLQKYGGNVRFVFKHLPLDEIHPQAFPAARAAFCAGEQGQFWKYHDALFASDNLSPETFNKTATEIGLDANKFNACSESEISRTAVLKDVREAKRLGIDGTPTFLINGKLISGVGSLESFSQIIERELMKTRQNNGKSQEK